MGVKMTCEYCGASVSPPHFDVKLEPPDAMFKPPIMLAVAKLLGIDVKGALDVVDNTRVLGTKVPAETADRLRAAIEKIGGKVTIIPS
jgi:ribosomal protein L7/L12